MAYKNKEAQAVCAKKHYLNNKDKLIKRAAKFKKEAVFRNKQYMSNFLLKNPCIDCGESDLRCLDFDHVFGEKIECISQMALNAVSIQTLQLEMNKCEVRCANCHRKITFERRRK